MASMTIAERLRARWLQARRPYDRLAVWWRQWALRYLPAGMILRPIEGFMGFFCLVVGLGILTSISQPPAAEQFLPDRYYVLWGCALTLGGAALMIGVYSMRWVFPPTVFEIQRLECYRLGMRLLSASTCIYALSAIAVAGVNGVAAFLFSSYFALSCLSRLLTLGRE